MSARRTAIGFDRYIEREWLDQTAHWAIQGKTRSEIHKLLDAYLKSYIKGKKSLIHAKTVLLGIWTHPKRDLRRYKKIAQGLYSPGTEQEKLAIHWGLAVATYPFFASLVRLMGRLYRLQGDIHSQELIRRSIELHGDTESVRRATRRLPQSLAQWGVLEIHRPRIFQVAPSKTIASPEILDWLLAAVLFSRDRPRLAFDELISDPVWFPFSFYLNPWPLPRTGFLEVVHQGIADKLIALRDQTG